MNRTIRIPMAIRHLRAAALGLLVTLLTAVGAPASGPHHDDHEEAVARGPRDGRLLESEILDLEITIFESGVPPELRVYPYFDGAPIDPAKVELEVELRRLGGRVDRIAFRPERDYLVGDRVIVEPHSFDVEVTARIDGETQAWSYSTYQGRTTLSPAALERSGIDVERAGPTTLELTVSLHGRIVPNADRVVHVMPRFPGVLRKVNKRVGDPVARGETLAVVEANESLRAYDVASPISGVVLRKHAAAGEMAHADDEIYVVADLSTVWLDLDVYRRDFSGLREGLEVLVDTGADGPPVRATIDYLSPFAATETQTLLARAVLENPDGRWHPGLFVTAHVVVDEPRVPVAVRSAALQRWRERDVVFVREGDVFEVRPVELGRSNGEWVEVTGGLAAGDEYASQNSFVLKADIDKAGATHAH